MTVDLYDTRHDMTNYFLQYINISIFTTEFVTTCKDINMFVLVEKYFIVSCCCIITISTVSFSQQHNVHKWTYRFNSFSMLIVWRCVSPCGKISHRQTHLDTRQARVCTSVISFWIDFLASSRRSSRIILRTDCRCLWIRCRHMMYDYSRRRRRCNDITRKRLVLRATYQIIR